MRSSVLKASVSAGSSTIRRDANRASSSAWRILLKRTASLSFLVAPGRLHRDDTKNANKHASQKMKTVTNKTQKSLTIPLPRGKTLHLGFGKTAAITTNASEHPPLKKLVDAGQIEIHDEGSPSAEGAGGGKASQVWMPRHGTRPGHRGGDR
jgi:hypothetical protein